MTLPKPKSYDSKCYTLAEAFIGSEPKWEPLRVYLAGHIQEEIEMVLEYDEDFKMWRKEHADR